MIILYHYKRDKSIKNSAPRKKCGDNQPMRIDCLIKIIPNEYVCSYFLLALTYEVLKIIGNNGIPVER